MRRNREECVPGRCQRVVLEHDRYPGGDSHRGNGRSDSRGYQPWKSSQERLRCSDRQAAMDATCYGERRPDSPAVDVPVVHESRIERGIEAGWVEERRRGRWPSPSVPDWRFKGVVGAATRQPRDEPEEVAVSDHLEKMIDVMEKSFANLNDRLAAVENLNKRDAAEVFRKDTKAGRRRESPDLSADRKLPGVASCRRTEPRQRRSWSQPSCATNENFLR